MIVDEDSARHWLSGLPEWDSVAAERLEHFVELLVDENHRQNLVSGPSLAQVWLRHIADSAQLLSHVPRGTSPWLDLGTGAGFPGLVIAILRPDLEIVMVESRPRRSEWLARVMEALELKAARIAAGQLEKVPDLAAAVISARAFAPLGRLLDLSARFSTSATTWLLPKGRSAGDELSGLHGWQHTFHVEPSLTDGQAGIVVGRLIGRVQADRKGKRG